MYPGSVIPPVLPLYPPNQNRRRRHLDSHDDEEQQSSFLVDKDGNEYDPYSLAWRYLGMYLDCDLDDEDDDDKEVDDDQDRRLGSGSGGDGECNRVLLWAAYHDPRYRGGSIGEYQFFDRLTETWDKSSCQTRRCARMDCHESRSHYKLVGVFKENDGLEDWAEQLFKHEGYCLWDSDTYEVMQNQRERWPQQCTKLYYTADEDGNSLYTHLKPDREGNIGMGIYLDEQCSQESSLTFADYVMAYYEYYYGSSDEGVAAVEYWNSTIFSWNEHMNTYKTCQPCRAYRLTADEEGDGSSGSKDDRSLAEENDGEGDDEQWGFNCYDDAGYTNCNQCYKFETKTDMEFAVADDLIRASRQGSILRITVDGKTYGEGGFPNSPPDVPIAIVVFLVCATAMVAMVLVYRKRRKVIELAGTLRDNLNTLKSEDTICDNVYNRHGTTAWESSSQTSTSSFDHSESQYGFSRDVWTYYAEFAFGVHRDDQLSSTRLSTTKSGQSNDFSTSHQGSYDLSSNWSSGSESEKWVEFPVYGIDYAMSADTRWSNLRKRILFPEETRWEDLRNKILGPLNSFSSYNFVMSGLSSSRDTPSDVSTDSRNGYNSSLDEDTHRSDEKRKSRSEGKTSDESVTHRDGNNDGHKSDLTTSSSVIGKRTRSGVTVTPIDEQSASLTCSGDGDSFKLESDGHIYMNRSARSIDEETLQSREQHETSTTVTVQNPDSDDSRSTSTDDRFLIIQKKLLSDYLELE